MHSARHVIIVLATSSNTFKTLVFLSKMVSDDVVRTIRQALGGAGECARRARGHAAALRRGER